jgi:hypothetical protein
VPYCVPLPTETHTHRIDTHTYNTQTPTRLLSPREAADLAVRAKLLREAKVVEVLLDDLGDERPDNLVCEWYVCVCE